MAEWLGDTPIFQATMTDEERNEFALFKTKVKAIDTKETDMATKKNVPTTTNTTIESKEDTTMSITTTAATTTNEQEGIMSITGIPMATSGRGVVYYDRRRDYERHVAIRNATKFGRTKGVEVASCIPGLTAANITKDATEVALLGKACKKYGWKNGVCTVAKAKAAGGTPNPEYKGHGWFVRFAGAKNELDGTVAYPMEAFVWEGGAPKPFVKKAAAPKATAPKATPKRGTAKTSRRKTTTKAQPKVEAAKGTTADATTTASELEEMKGMVKALMAQNEQLLAIIAAKANVA